MISLYNGQVSSEVQLKFNGPSPTVWGVLLDGETGVAVDNFPMRGSSGTGYATINRSGYSKQMTLVNAKLVVMQYGINVVPNPVKSYKFYERMFSSELRAIKAANPDISILVIGPSDMSRKRAGEYESYPNIEKIRDAMRNAAFDNGCAFWDLYTAMGGKNSMVSWVQNEPPLASKDYTHFNSRGARYIGEMLYNAIMSDYSAWKLTQ
jgi:lysophospholipase L1-like esterase